MKPVKSLLPLLIIILSCSKTETPLLNFPSVINDGMVLQRNTDVVLWGKTNPKQKIAITASWGAKTNVRANSSGEWKTSIKTIDAGGPFEIEFQTKDTSCVVSDIYLGEVWLCSGQSNMEMTLAGWPPTDTVLNSDLEIQSAQYPLIRLFNVNKNTSAAPLTICEGSWKAISPEVASAVSATAYFFGRELFNELDVPVGLITSSWGGTPAESWTPAEFLKQVPAYAGIVDSLDSAKIQYDSLMVWMDQLPNKVIDPENKAFYGGLDFGDEKFAAADYDDSQWELIQVPANWENDRLPNFDGVVWYRVNFNVPAGYVGKEMVLHLGPIDDMDMTFINGEKIGEIMEDGRWKDERNYVVPAGLLAEGENILAVCVIDNRGGGGIYGEKEPMLSDKKGNSLKLNKQWKFLPVAEILSNKIYFYTDEFAFSSRPELSISIGPYTPTFLYNAMIYPLVPYTIQGAIWYQGESNVGRGFEYRTLFPAMINSWRTVWDRGDFPFYYVQIAPFNYWEEVKSPAAEVREAQLMALSLPNTGMVVTMDIGNPENIHPANKQAVGKRLALWALANDYGYDSIVYSGPLYKSLAISDNKAIIEFDFAETGLVAKDGPLTDFEIAGEDQVYYPAEAVIEGNKVLVHSNDVDVPYAVRYGWGASAEPNLFNGAGLPASPFRTDNWKRLSE